MPRQNAQGDLRGGEKKERKERRRQPEMKGKEKKEWQKCKRQKEETMVRAKGKKRKNI